MEEEYGKFLKSENALLMMLDFVTLVCVLISLFGVFSLVTLDCEKRRKEIAIRKVNGAVTPHIMQSFLLKYMLLLLVASAIAFPTGYLIMKPWVESYVLQTNIDFWIYPAIWLVLAALITLCTGWRIWRAGTPVSHTNSPTIPALYGNQHTGAGTQPGLLYIDIPVCLQ